ncbi:AraC family transcriptional regulator [Cellulophaga sp. 20_2_10]|uniref:AraC family transcriptional regulator n=1 Tax=Polaribacter sejongensis TaxID=985043 RepID=A0ABM6Q3S7_9FLAO|nr:MULTISPECIES: AraC family transcriptional regulator [Flavobacteriaceae]AUC23907.1 AraC family transcriptional regulator [Polaribacter sejongensis]MCL5246286.1 AraC family transcriptional regulator [Cellulophaga sp. 20_2_10]
MQPKFEKVALNNQKSIIAFRYSGDRFYAPWHFHPQHELTFIEKSSGTKFIGDYVGPFEEGELVLVRTNVPHCWKNNSIINTGCSSIVIQWNTGIYAKVPEMESVFKMLKAASKGILFTKENASEVFTLLKELLTLEGTELYLKFQNILVLLSRFEYRELSEKSFIDDLPSEYSSRIRKVHDYVESHYHKKIQLKELADLVNMSEQSFSRFFNKIMGRPFFTFLNQYKINMAKRMLMDTDWSVREICFACGYESVPFFHRQFKKFTNNTPSFYKRKQSK